MLSQNLIFSNFMTYFSLLKFDVCSKVLVILHVHPEEKKNGGETELAYWKPLVRHSNFI